MYKKGWAGDGASTGCSSRGPRLIPRTHTIICNFTARDSDITFSRHGIHMVQNAHIRKIKRIIIKQLEGQLFTVFRGFPQQSIGLWLRSAHTALLKLTHVLCNEICPSQKPLDY